MKFPLISPKALIRANTKRQRHIITGILDRTNYLVCLFFTPTAKCSILSCINEFYGQLLPDDIFIVSVKFVVKINHCNKHRKNRIDFIKADSSSLGTYLHISCTSQFRMRQRSLMVFMLISLLCFSLCRVLLDK